MAGETTGSVAADTPYEAAEGMFLVPFASQAYGSTDNQDADVKQFGYLPANCTVHAFIYGPSDMDTNVSPTLVHKIVIGSTDAVTGLTGAQTGAKSVVPVVPPVTVTSKSLVTVVTSSAAATAATGTLQLTAICQK